jgi:hypothetical protein
MKATPKFHSVNDSLVTALENCCAEQIFERKIEKHNTDMIFFMSLNSLSSNIVIKTTGQENNGLKNKQKRMRMTVICLCVFTKFGLFYRIKFAKIFVHRTKRKGM